VLASAIKRVGDELKECDEQTEGVLVPVSEGDVVLDIVDVGLIVSVLVRVGEDVNDTVGDELTEALLVLVSEAVIVLDIVDVGVFVSVVVHVGEDVTDTLNDELTEAVLVPVSEGLIVPDTVDVGSDRLCARLCW
jgi:hypothetical protein